MAGEAGELAPRFTRLYEWLFAASLLSFSAALILSVVTVLLKN